MSKLDLMTEISNMKMKFANLEKDKLDAEQKLMAAQVIFWTSGSRLFSDKNIAV